MFVIPYMVYRHIIDDVASTNLILISVSQDPSFKRVYLGPIMTR